MLMVKLLLLLNIIASGSILNVKTQDYSSSVYFLSDQSEEQEEEEEETEELAA